MIVLKLTNISLIGKKHDLVLLNVTKWYIFVSLWIRNCTIQKFYHSLIDGMWMEKDIFIAGSIIKSLL